MAKVLGKNFSYKHIFRDSKRKSAGQQERMLYMRIGVGTEYSLIRSYSEEEGMHGGKAVSPEDYIEGDKRIIAALVKYYEETLNPEEFSINLFVTRGNSKVKRLTSSLMYFFALLDDASMKNILAKENCKLFIELMSSHGDREFCYSLLLELSPRVHKKLWEARKPFQILNAAYHYYLVGEFQDFFIERYPDLKLKCSNPNSTGLTVVELLDPKNTTIFCESMKMNNVNMKEEDLIKVTKKYIEDGDEGMNRFLETYINK